MSCPGDFVIICVGNQACHIPVAFRADHLIGFARHHTARDINPGKRPLTVGAMGNCNALTQKDLRTGLLGHIAQKPDQGVIAAIIGMDHLVKQRVIDPDKPLRAPGKPG
eukprot:NODE_10402_length_489_cov_0.988950_g10379_i0.p2 GENE.NODE_10402_length_489_cov_0.988950_g10379_i0~~NODE_10402_length_489_cov_0.988950_g10379_i0.p2  ORF type:complete len:109 (-),score=7.65 NODE_10402_length_489_cov_0.988950_g10379_i0:105-431(-)